MRLYLSSYRVGDDPARLQRLVPPGTRVAVSANALDNQAAVVRDKIQSMERTLLQSLGYVTDTLDLRTFFGRADIASTLSRYGLVWATGGNTFVLNLAMKLSGFATALRPLLDRDAIAYGGYSAGVIVATPTLHGVEHVDAIDDFPADYPDKTVVWDGMGLVDYAIAVHYDSDHAESKKVDMMIAELERSGRRYVPLRDGEVIVVE